MTTTMLTGQLSPGVELMRATNPTGAEPVPVLDAVRPRRPRLAPVGLKADGLLARQPQPAPTGALNRTEHRVGDSP